MKSPIVIYGSGISGLVAAINLKRDGFDVEVRDNRDRIGGPPDWHPSVHLQHFDLAQTSRYIGIDLDTCFRRVERQTFYFYGIKRETGNPTGWLLCEKGPRHLSIEIHLYRIAVHEGVAFVFNAAFNPAVRDACREEPDCIVATGLETAVYDMLGIPRVAIYGYRGTARNKRGHFAVSYFDRFTRSEFAYAASFEDVLFGLLFSLQPLEPADLTAFSRCLLQTEGIVIDHWNYSTGAVPTLKSLRKNNLVLAGTLSGMIDPFI